MQVLHRAMPAALLTGVGLVPLFLLPHAIALPIDSLTIGAGEKGALLGIESNLDYRNQLEVGIQGIRTNLTHVNIGLSSQVPILYTSIGGRIAYNYFLNGNLKRHGPFLQLSLSGQRIDGSTEIKSGNQSYSIGGIDFTCSDCGSITLKTRNPAIAVIPGISLGWQAILSRRLRVKAVVGAQYYNVPNTYWESEQMLPRFARQQMNKITNNLNHGIQSLSDFYPTALVSISYQL